MRRDSIVLCSLVIILGLANRVGAQGIPLMIPHSGTVLVNGQPFNGTGQFKFAIINKQGCGFQTNDGCVTYWSSDGIPSAGDEPDNGVPIIVNNGLFSLKLGDISLVNNNGANMPEVPASVSGNPETYLRIWFNDGAAGFQRLTPDRQLVSVPYAYRAEVANSVVGTNAISSTGNVGIGTASPNSALHVKTNGDYAGEFEKSSPDANAWIKVVNDARSYLVGVRGDTADAFTIFDNVAGVNRFIIDTTGNVGIGTTSPVSKLHIFGIGTGLPPTSGTAVSTGEVIRIRPGDNAVLDIGGNSVLGAWLQSTDQTSLGTNYPLLLNPNGGSVGIGTTNPNDLLEVFGIGPRVRITSNNINANPKLLFDHPGSDNHYFLTWEQDALFFERDEDDINHQFAQMTITRIGNVGIGRPNPQFPLDVNGFIRADNVTVPSDLRYKTNISTFSSALDKILHLRGVNYDWRKEEFPDMNFHSGRQVGLIAQEVKEVLPEIVFEDNEGMQSVAYSAIIPVLIEAIKEQQQVIEDLKKKTSEMDALKVRLSELEGHVLWAEKNLKKLQRSASGDSGEVVIGREQQALVAEADRRD